MKRYTAPLAEAIEFHTESGIMNASGENIRWETRRQNQYYENDFFEE